MVTLNTLENVSDKIFWFPESVAPVCVCCGSGLCGDDFVERLPLFLQSRYFLASANEQVAIKGVLGNPKREVNRARRAQMGVGFVEEVEDPKSSTIG